MEFGLINGRKQANIPTNGFLGLNRKEKGKDGEFEDMDNLSSDRYPCLAPAKSRKAAFHQNGIRAIIAPQYSSNEITSFTGVAGNKFYYNGTEAGFGDGITEIPDGDLTLVDFNSRIIICVYDDDKNKNTMLYYDYTATGDGKVKQMEKGARSITCSAYSSGNPENDISVTNYIQSSNTDWTKYFREGDSVFIEGFAKAQNNTMQLDSRYQSADKNKAVSCIVEKIDTDKLYLQMYNYSGEPLVFTKETNKSGVSVYTKIPTMNHVCVHNNRLWGTNPNGEYIYASKQGDCFNFNTFQGLANDSYYCEVGTPGDFVGIVSCRDNLVAFKREYIHQIYGDKPSNFTMPKQLSDCGCIDIRSAVQTGSMLYFLGYGGFYSYTGGQPQLISQKLNSKYKTAVGMTDGEKYIVSAVRADNRTELLVYDTRYGLWHKESSITAVGSLRWHEKLYIADKNTVYEYNGNNPQSWSCTSVVMYEGIFDNKGMTELWIRARIDKDARIIVSTSEDGGAFLERGTLNGDGTLKVYRIPIRFITGEFFQYNLSGSGNAVIYDIDRVVSSGGRKYKG